MHKKLQDFLAEKKRFELEARREHLIALGLVDETKPIKEWHEKEKLYDEETVFIQDKETGEYYREYFDAIDVTDEEYAEICKYAPGDSKEDKSTAEKTLAMIAWIVLSAGVIISVAMLLFLFVGNVGGGFAMPMIASIIWILGTSIFSWGILQVLCNISFNIKDIKKKLL